MSRIFIGGLPEDASRTELEREFEYFGRLRDVWVARNPPGFGFIIFEDARDADDAVKEMDGKRVCGTRIRVEYARGPTRGGGRGGRGARSEKCHNCGRFGHSTRECRSSRSNHYSGGYSRSRDSRYLKIILLVLVTLMSSVIMVANKIILHSCYREMFLCLVFANKNVLYLVKIYSILTGIFVCSFYKFATSATPALTNKNVASPTTTASSIKKNTNKPA